MNRLEIMSILVIVCLLFSITQCFMGESEGIKISRDMQAFIKKVIDQFELENGEKTLVYDSTAHQ